MPGCRLHHTRGHDPPLDVDIGEQRSTRPIVAPHSFPRESLPQSQGIIAKTTNTSDFSADFFNSLLEDA